MAGTIVLILLYQGLSHFMRPGPEGGADSPETTAVVVAGRYIPAFSPVGSRLAGIKNFPRGCIPPGAFHAVEELVDQQNQPLFLSAVALPEGQPLTRAVLREIGKNHGLASLLTPGKVAAALAVDKVHGAGGWIQPGDSIAVFQTSLLEGRSAPRTQLLFPALTVLAVDKSRLGASEKEGENKEASASFMEMPEEHGTVLTVLLSSMEAPAFIEAQEQGRLTAALRAFGDTHGK